MIDDKEIIIKFLDLNLKPKEKERRELGEVFTPRSLINEMLDKLPKEVFSNKELRWFDPAVGIGNFMIEIYWRLMDGLKDEIIDFDERKSHIISKMLYMSELNEDNIKECKRIFREEINIYEGDTLQMSNEDKFDIIVGNPPYNKGGIRSFTGKQLGDKNETIWPLFVKKSFDILKNDGYLLFITPLSWLKKSHSVHNLLLEKRIIWMKLWDNSQSKKMINADIPISLYLVKNNLNEKIKTEITSVLKRRNLIITSNEYLNKEYSIPLAYHSIFNKLTTFIEENNCKLDINTKVIKSVGEKQKIPKEYNLKDLWAIDTYRLNEGLIVKKATEQHPDADKKKLIIANKSSFKGAFIDDGKLSLTGAGKYYIIGDNLELIRDMLNYKISNIISQFTKYGQDFLSNEAFTFIPDIRKLGIKDITEDEFYKLLKLTQDEIKQIEN